MNIINVVKKNSNIKKCKRQWMLVLLVVVKSVLLIANAHNCKGRVKFSQLTMGKTFKKTISIEKI